MAWLLHIFILNDGSCWEAVILNSLKNVSYRLPLLYKVLCIALIAFFVVLGLVGLILPIIPGLVFLFIAAVLLARISSRFESILESNSKIEGWMKHADAINGLSISQRIRLSFWISAKLINDGIEAGIRQFKKATGSS